MCVCVFVFYPRVEFLVSALKLGVFCVCFTGSLCSFAASTQKNCIDESISVAAGIMCTYDLIL